jgi:hypothetical protein
VKKTKTKRRAPAPAKRAESTALVRVAKTIEESVRQLQARVTPTTVSPSVEVLPPEVEMRRLADDVVLGELGIVELKLTPEEEKVLGEPVNEGEVLIKPTGAVYLPHIVYTRWLNRAFGRLGWAVVPAGMPKKAGTSVTIPYVLHVHGKPVAFAWGEQEFFENNRDQTYGDAIESTVANALRRIAKRMGVSLELWDRSWGEDWKAKHAIRVKVKGPRDDKPRTQWRRKIDAPLPWEQGRAGDRDLEDDDREPPAPRQQTRRSSAPPAEEKPAGHHPQAGEPITQPQRQRLVMIIRNSGREESQVSSWLKSRFRVDSLKGITRKDYEFICRVIEAPGDLPE